MLVVNLPPELPKLKVSETKGSKITTRFKPILDASLRGDPLSGLTKMLPVSFVVAVSISQHLPRSIAENATSEKRRTCEASGDTYRQSLISTITAHLDETSELPKFKY